MLSIVKRVFIALLAFIAPGGALYIFIIIKGKVFRARIYKKTRFLE